MAELPKGTENERLRKMKINNIIAMTARISLSLGMVGMWSVFSALKAEAANIQTFHFLNDTSETAGISYSNDGGANFNSASAGRYKATLNGGPNIYVFCVDLTHHIGFGDSYQADLDYRMTDAAGYLSGSYYLGGIGSAMTPSDYGITVTGAEAQKRADMAAYLLDTYLNASSFPGVSGSTSLLDNLVALQLAEWDILQDGGNGISTGTFQLDSGGITNYNSLVNYYEGVASLHNTYVSLTDTWIQAPIANDGSHIQNFATNRANVPEPGTAANILGIVITGGGYLIKKRRK